MKKMACCEKASGDTPAGKHSEHNHYNWTGLKAVRSPSGFLDLHSRFLICQEPVGHLNMTQTIERRSFLRAGAIGLAGLGFTGLVPAWARSGSPGLRSEEHTSELQSLLRHSYSSFCLTKNKPPAT